MSDVPEEERCIAVTSDGTQCSRLAKQTEFCFQHDDTFETIEEGDGPLFQAVSERVEDVPAQLSGVERDVRQNFQDIAADWEGIVADITSTNPASLLESARDALRTTAPTPFQYGLVGGAGGSIFGPVGTAGGMTAGVWYGVYRVIEDNRAVQATGDVTVPSDAEIVASDDSRITDVKPVQIALQAAIEKDEEKREWIQPRITREWNMDSVEEALSKLPGTENESGIVTYYIRHVESNTEMELYFGEVTDE